MAERRNTETERLQIDVQNLHDQLKAAISAKCQALVENNEIDSLKLQLEYKERRLDQERVLLRNQVDTLTQNLNDCTEELLILKKDNRYR